MKIMEVVNHSDLNRYDKDYGLDTLLGKEQVNISKKINVK